MKASFPTERLAVATLAEQSVRFGRGVRALEVVDQPGDICLVPVAVDREQQEQGCHQQEPDEVQRPVDRDQPEHIAVPQRPSPQGRTSSPRIPTAPSRMNGPSKSPT